jgi:hypothetical protein
MSTSIWPYDTFLTPKPPIKLRDYFDDPITCFVATPFEPRERWDDLLRLIQTVANQVGSRHGVSIECYRADSITSSGMVHPEIWESLRTADFTIFDVSGENGNVMLELGVASAWRRKEHVIILRDKADERPHLFDINPARHIEYSISFAGLSKLATELEIVMLKMLATIPFEDPHPPSIDLPFRALLSDGVDAPELYTEDITHRRLLDDCLEFGAPLSYRHSWMSLGDLSLARVHVKADMKLTLPAPRENPNDPFVGVMVRGQSYFANWGHLILVRPDGKVYLTVREDDTGKHHDELLGEIFGFDIRAFTNFDIVVDDSVISVKVSQRENLVEVSKNLSELPYVFSAGRVIFIAGLCRVGIRNIEIDSP